MPTYTSTSTFTFIRLELIKMQLKIALRRTTNISQDTLENSIDKGITNRWINEITIYGMDRSDLCRAQLNLEIDWNEYDLQISMGKVQIHVDDGLLSDDGSFPDLDEAIKLFNKFVAKYSLHTKWTVTYRSDVDRQKINSILGFTSAEPLKWAKTKNPAWSTNIDELPEVKIGLYFVEGE